MKLASRISSIRRQAWKTLSSCSRDSAAMWRDSLASRALAGWMRSPHASSTRVTGSCASQSICRSGCSARSSRAMATSRHAWPRPIGEETYSARLRPAGSRGATARPRRRAAVGALGEVAQQLVEAHRVARVRAVADVVELDELGAGRRRRRRAPRSGGISSSSSPWVTSSGQRTRAMQVVDRLAVQAGRLAS